ncbi:adenylyltransferase and sulfurtransferase [Pseudarcicella hirudinis]|uniref:Molybdopterin-synthase adenylyltransferase n=1 Tax=Pseudarcicella hirudinis TaxID=1079859 RepID=A0A1I5QWT8_9BACT|nr:molybdopterin-synthase adenylyltransferase MoeB [Pseudarcicella hirudinis]SFP50712.1 adenylyltransferase and sulfurtransferase [Pseudarcicella hirudinis]
MLLLPAEQTRYQKHLLLPQIGLEGQLKLKNAKVLVVGAGGLGCPVLLYLAAAGVGKIGIIDGDVVDLTNLQRQVIYKIEDIGISKAVVAVSRLKSLNDNIDYETINSKLKKENAEPIIGSYDIVVDCTDNFTTRYLINDFCVKLGKPYVYGAIHQFEGQVSVFNFKDKDGTPGPTYRCLFPEQPSEAEIPNCSDIGVLGILPGALGMYQANEVVKMITGIGKVLSGELLMLDLLENTSQKIKVKRRANAEELIFPVAGKDESAFDLERSIMKTITVYELAEKLENKDDILIVDVRNHDEYETCHLEEALLIPMNTIPNNIKHIPKDKPVVVHCHHGIRSANVIQFLEQNHEYQNLYNLTGGIDAWAREIDEEMMRY